MKRIVDNQGSTFILQIEFQVADEPEMVYRMMEYYAMLERKYKIPIEQYVIFVSDIEPSMISKLERKRVHFEYQLICFSEIDYHLFLSSGNPEEVVLSILANFKGESPENALKQIIQRIEETAKGDFALKKYFKQLRILAQLRKLEQKLKDIVMDSIAKYIDEERDVAFLVGFDKGKESVVINLLSQTDFGFDKIANIANVTIEFVQSVKQKISSKK